MIINRLGFAIALAALVLGLAVGLRYAESAGLLAADDVRRVMQVAFGLMLAAYANFMPKQLGPVRGSARAESWAQATLRVGGWSLTLAGLAYAGLWALAPLRVADIASMAVVAAALLVTLGYALRSFTACRRAGDASGRG